MKVSNEGSKIYAVAEAKAKAPVVEAKKQSSVEPQDKVLLSEEAHHRARVAELRAMVQGGQNIVNPERIARGMVTDMLAGSV